MGSSGFIVPGLARSRASSARPSCVNTWFNNIWFTWSPVVIQATDTQMPAMTEPQTQTGPSTAGWAWMSPWPRVAVQAFQIGICPEAIWSPYFKMAPDGVQTLDSCNRSHEPQNADPDCSRAMDSGMGLRCSLGVDVNMAQGSRAGHPNLYGPGGSVALWHQHGLKCWPIPSASA